MLLHRYMIVFAQQSNCFGTAKITEILCKNIFLI